jgi:hypothetical protein
VPDAARRWLVLGVYPSTIRAGGAIASLAAAADTACDVLLLSGPRLRDEASDFGAPDAHVTIHQVDMSGSISATRALSRSDFLSRFWVDMIGAPEHARETVSPRVEELFVRLVDHLDTGAAILVVRVSDSERQLLVSRTLLASKCEVLLTHEVANAEAHSGTAGHDEGCCETCTSRSCGKIGPA